MLRKTLRSDVESDKPARTFGEHTKEGQNRGAEAAEGQVEEGNS